MKYVSKLFFAKPSRVTTLFILALFLGVGVQAQNSGSDQYEFRDNPDLHLGVKAGIGFSNLVSSELTGNSVRPGMVVGLYAGYVFKKRTFLKVEFNGNLKGSLFNYSQAASLEKLSLFYLDIPITVHYYFVKNAKLLPLLGVQPSIIFRKDAYKTQEAVPQPVSVGIKNYDFGIVGGVYYKLNKHVGVQLLYSYGLLNINQKAPNQLALPFYPFLGNGSPIYNRNLQLCLVF
jgi:hypothetical protein